MVIGLLALDLPTRSVEASDADLASREFQRRVESCSLDDASGVLSLATWAIENQLPEDADKLLRDHLDVNPRNEQARAMLVQIAGKRKLPRESAALQSATAVLPEHFVPCESAHFVVLSDAGLIRARQHSEMLERAEHQFRRFAARLDLQPLPLQHKLVCILFRSVEDYRGFALAHDGVDAEWVTGYYTPAQDRMVFYDAELAAPPGNASALLDQAQASMAALEMRTRDLERSNQAEQAQLVRRQMQDLQNQCDQANHQLDAAARATAIATTLHEAMHQLLYHTRVQGLQVRSPLWISEGLATNFETDAPNQAFGPDHEHRPRRADFDQYLTNDRLLPLAELVQIDELGANEDRRAAVVYAQSYAFVKWACRFKASQLREYLDLMRMEPPGEPTAARHLEIFESAFGAVAPIERTWLRYEQHRQKAAPEAMTIAQPQ